MMMTQMVLQTVRRQALSGLLTGITNYKQRKGPDDNIVKAADDMVLRLSHRYLLLTGRAVCIVMA